MCWDNLSWQPQLAAILPKENRIKSQRLEAEAKVLRSWGGGEAWKVFSPTSCPGTVHLPRPKAPIFCFPLLTLCFQIIWGPHSAAILNRWLQIPQQCSHDLTFCPACPSFLSSRIEPYYLWETFRLLSTNKNYLKTLVKAFVSCQWKPSKMPSSHAPEKL